MLEYNMTENAMHSLNEAIHYYVEGQETEKMDRYKFCILLTCHCVELLLKEILYNNHPILIYEDIDNFKGEDEDNKTIGFAQALKRVKTICGIDLGRYQQYLSDLATLRNRIQHFKFSVDDAYCQKIMVQSFSAIEHIVLSVLKRQFNDFDDIISQEQISYLHEDKTAYEARKQDVRKEIQEKRLKRFQFEYQRGKCVDIPCPNCSEHFLVIGKEGKIVCKICGEEYSAHYDIYENDRDCIVSTAMLRELGRRKHLITYNIFECNHCENDTLTYNEDEEAWVCWVCGNRISGTITCYDCGDELPDDEAYYHTAVSYLDTDSFSYLCDECSKKLREGEYGGDFEIS